MVRAYIISLEFSNYRQKRLIEIDCWLRAHNNFSLFRSCAWTVRSNNRQNMRNKHIILFRWTDSNYYCWSVKCARAGKMPNSNALPSALVQCPMCCSIHDKYGRVLWTRNLWPTTTRGRCCNRKSDDGIQCISNCVRPMTVNYSHEKC